MPDSRVIFRCCIRNVALGAFCAALLGLGALPLASAAPAKTPAKAAAKPPAKAAAKPPAKAAPRVRAKPPAKAAPRVRAKPPAKAAAKPSAKAAPRVRAKPPAWSPRLPAMALYHLHNRERVLLRPYDGQGRLRPEAILAFSRFMRCTHTGQIRPIHWRLLVVLYDTWLHFGQPQVTVFSGHRPKEVARLQTSRHVTGHAVDFNFNGIDNARVRDYLRREHDQVGVGFYPNSWHVHLDVRTEKSFWIDYGKPGGDAVYARNAEGDLQKGVARRGHVPGRDGAGARSTTGARALGSASRPLAASRGRLAPRGAPEADASPPKTSPSKPGSASAGPNEHASAEDL